MLNLGFDFWWFHAQCLLVSFLVVTEKVENIGCKSTSIGQFLIFESFSSKTHQIWRFGGLGVSKRCPTWCAQQLGIFKGWTSHKNTTMMPKGCENYAKMILKWSQNDLKMMPASPRKLVGGSVFGRARLGPRATAASPPGPGPARTARKRCHQPILIPLPPPIPP